MMMMMANLNGLWDWVGMAPCMGPLSPICAYSLWAGLCAEKLVKPKKKKLKSLVFLCRESSDSARTLSNWLYFSRPQYRFAPSYPPTPPFQGGATWYWLAGMEVNVRTSYHAEYCKDNRLLILNN